MPGSNTPGVIAILGGGVVEHAGLAADDLGLTHGDGCFDSMRVVRDAHGTCVDHRTAHLARFAASSSAMDLPAVDLDAWSRLIDTALDAWSGQGAATCRLLWTRGP
ncbi:MAG: hypothetical protein ACK5LS_04690 [Propioniciclava sp.]